MLLSHYLPPFSLPAQADYGYQYDTELEGYHVYLPQGGELFYKEAVFNDETSLELIAYFTANNTFPSFPIHWHQQLHTDTLAQIIWKNIAWQQDQIKLFGKEMLVPRLSAWYGDAHAQYTYSGLTLQPKAWNEGLLFIKEKVEYFAKTPFNSVLMNWYRNGQDSMGWHADDEKELGKNPIIASINFGATRRFLMRSKADKSQKLEIPLKNGTLLVMKGTTQHHWQHAVPKEPKIQRSRFNLTFRYILP